MRKTLTALILASALPTLALAAPFDGPRSPACDKGSYGEHRGAPGQGLFKSLKLTPEQREQVAKLMRDRKDSPHTITQKYLDKLSDADKAALKKELETARVNHENAFKAILTPEQLKQFEQQKKDREQRRADREEFEAWKAQRDKKAQ
ncbi:Spy/CpxP family protein refolding chaperone [Aquipseudomonas campi]